MKYNQIGNAGLKVSSISLGTWLNFSSAADSKSLESCLNLALEKGVNSFDTADSYEFGEAEAILGKLIFNSNVSRHDLVISTKGFFPRRANSGNIPVLSGLSRKSILTTVNQSLVNLRTDYIDIFYCHRFDPTTDLLETLFALDTIVKSGKVMYWGTSKWTSEQLRLTIQLCEKFNLTKPICVQELYNLFHTESLLALKDDLASFNLGFFGYSPLARGVLTNKYSNGIPLGSRKSDPNSATTVYDITEKNQKILKDLSSVADHFHCTPSQLVLSYYLAREKCTSLIIGCKRPDQLLENLDIFSLQLKESDLVHIEQIVSNHEK